MAFNLRNRSFLKLLDFTPKEIQHLLDLSASLKAAKYAGTEQQMLKGKNVVLLFEKDSTRTRCAFEVAAMDQGAGVTYLGPSGSQMGKKESMKDTARVLGRMYDGIEYRGYDQEIVETFSLQINNKDITHFSIVDMYGKKLQTGKVKSSDMQFDMSEYAPGVYFIQFYDGERQRGIAKIITN